MAEPPEMEMRSYGVSPWELEVAYGYFSPRFAIRQEEAEEDPDFVSVLIIKIPLPFSEDFFEWFEFRRWEKIKALFKEMKRRRGGKKAIRIRVDFAGRPAVSFVMDAMDKQLYDNSVEKIDFVLELLQYHLNPANLPEGVTHAVYRYDVKSRRWLIGEAFAGGDRYVPAGDGWKIT